MQKYISINIKTDESDTRVKLLNPENEFQGTLKTVDSSGTVKDKDKVQDVNDIFMHKIQDIKQINKDESGPGYSLDDVVVKLNEVIQAINKA